MVYYSLLSKRPHLLIVVLLFKEYPLKIRHSLSWLYLLPYLPLQQHFPHQILVVITSHYQKCRFIYVLHYLLLLVLHLLALVLLFTTTEPWPPWKTSRVQSIRQLLLSLLLIVRHLLRRLLPYLEVMQVYVLSRLLLCHQESHLLRIRRVYFFAYEDIRERLVVVEESTVRIDEEKVVIEFFRDVGRVLDLR